MNKKLLLKQVLASIILISSLIMVSGNANAGWSEMNGTTPGDGYYDVWGTSATDVFISGCTGTRMHYDGNPQETWHEWPGIQGH